MRMFVTWRKPLAGGLPNQPGISITTGKQQCKAMSARYNLLGMETTCNTVRKKGGAIRNIGQYDIHIKSRVTVRSASLFLNCMKNLLLFSNC